MIKRDYYLKKIIPFIDTDLVKVLTGIRRSGKSVMMLLIKDELIKRGVLTEQIISINFEDFDYIKLRDPFILNEWIKTKARGIKGKIYLFLDEIQEVSNWEQVINSFRVSLNIDIYITGSNAKLFSGDMATYLAGRYVQFDIYPFSYHEYLLARGVSDSAAEFLQYIQRGGMPFLINLSYQKDASRQYLLDVYNSVLLKDIIQRNKIRDADLLERILMFSFSNIGIPFSASSIAKFLKKENRKQSNDTILNQLKACTSAYILNKIPRIDLKTQKLLTVNEKYYVADLGLRDALFGNKPKDIGQILENIVCLELLRRGYKVSVGKIGKLEIDFVAEKNGQRMYIQVSYLLADEKTIDREFGVYGKIKDNYPKYVLSLDDFDFSRDGIIHENIRHFLLREDW
ncbi:ATP-binding protein [Succinivibrio dextrinosolvens]|uniref:ATP-binding protein n=1 Tax=Succinivibrio dextrinosolvens TaxID=83771 RepID=UPI00241F4A7E|nr:ATP-binding protein [Succinivibrio dextrinosolvens]MBE6424023.1 ATP-binding protein [Succinivibrio dextrinosolvens]